MKISMKCNKSFDGGGEGGEVVGRSKVLWSMGSKNTETNDKLTLHLSFFLSILSPLQIEVDMFFFIYNQIIL